ncbi:MAG: tetratricopeptide repeat protein [Planctomycetaceae bacterium]
MKLVSILRAGLVAVVVVAGATEPAWAVEPYMEFAVGLRERGYFDLSEQYLQELSQRNDAPADIRALASYELGITLRDSARSLLIPEEQRQKLDEAQAAFERFAKSSPKHELAGRANSERAKILVEKARVDIWDADGTSDDAKKQQLRASARQFIAQAREIFATAAEQLKKQFETFPGFISQEERDKIRQREAAEAEYIQAQLDLAETSYWEAQTYDVSDSKRKEMLSNAMLEFEKIHTAYRSMIGGLLARLWQGKCLEEIGQRDGIDAALGIYGELLRHSGSSSSMLALQAKAQQFQLICYNHDAKKEYRLVNQLASDWQRNDANRRLRSTETGKGIEWEQARALEKLGDDRTVPENERTTFLNQGLGIARGLSQRTGPYKAPAAAMVARLSTKLGRDANDPTDFNSAYGRADELFEQAQQINEKISSALGAGKSDQAKTHADARKGVASELTRMLNLALKMANSQTDVALLRRSELMLAVGYVYQEKPYEAAAVAEYFLRNYGNSQPEMLRLAGEIALSALNDAYQYAPEDDRSFEKGHILQLADMLSTKWPETELAVGAHLSAGRLFWDDHDYEAAASSWLKVPATSKSYGAAQLKSGAALLEAYSQKSQLDDSERPSSEELTKLRAAAEQHLQQGVEYEESKTSAETENPDLLRGKLALAQVRNLMGIYKTQGMQKGAIELLTAEPHSLLKAIETPPGETRPDDPTSLKSRQFASIVYQTLLRAEIGVKNIDAARDARAKLEEVGAGGDAAALTQVFVQFGQQLQEELDQLRASGATERLKEVRDGFEAFLSDLYDRDESQQTFNSLLWIAETYASLGESSEDDLLKSKEYFDRSATAYQRIIARGESDPAFVGSPQNATAVRVRMLECRLRQKDYESAEQVLFEVLKASPNAPNVQESGARLYQEWAESGDPSKYQYALNGRKEPVVLWGWGELANRMRSQTNQPALKQMYLDASYHYAESYFQQAAKQSGDERKGSLDRALFVLDTFSRTSRDVPDEVYKQMNDLYRSCLRELGKPEIDMPVPGERSGGNATKPTAPKQPKPSGGTQPTPVANHAPEPEQPSNAGNVIVVLGLLGLGLAAVVGIFVWTTGQSKKKRAAALAAIAASTPAPKKKKVAARPEGKRPSSDSASP